MGDQATGAETAGVATAETAAPAPEHLSLDAIRSLVSEAVTASLSGYSTKINAELAGLRKRLPRSEPETGNGHTEAAPAVTMDDLRATRELGRLEALLPAEMLESLKEDLEGLSLPQQAKMLRMVGRVAQPRDADKSRGETPASTTRSARAAASAQRDAAPRPTTLLEYVELARSDPKRKASLDADPTFDPSDLPRTAARR